MGMRRDGGDDFVFFCIRCIRGNVARAVASAVTFSMRVRGVAGRRDANEPWWNDTDESSSDA